MKARLALLLVGGLLVSSCSDRDESVVGGVSSQMQLSIGNGASVSSEDLDNVSALLYTQDLLSKRLDNMKPDAEGLFMVATDKTNADKLVFLAGDYTLPTSEFIGDYSQLCGLVTPAVDFNSSFPSLFYTGQRKLSSLTDNLLEMSLTRSVAKLELKKITHLPVELDSCIISNLADRAYIIPGNEVVCDGVKYLSRSMGVDELPVLGSEPQTIAYLYESTGEASKVHLYVSINGVKSVLTATLPKVIERNKRYEIGVNSNGVVVFTHLEVLPWEVGNDSEANSENAVVKIDIDNCEFPNGVSLSPGEDTIYIAPAFSGDFILALQSPEDTEIKVENSNIEIVPVELSRANYVGNRFKFSLRSNEINKPQTITTLLVKSKSDDKLYDRHLVLVREPFRTRFEELSVSSNGGNVNFDDYVDGELAKLNSSWSISSVETRSLDDQFNWLRVMDSQDSYILEGAFKPNDVEARGQSQSSVVRVTYGDGVDEEFVVTRPRKSIPVITQGGLYWSKYNMRGNSKSYEDQIGFDNDMDRELLFDFLKECSDEEFAFYVGAEYRGISTQGLYLKRDASSETPSLLYEGYSSIPDGQVSNGPADRHCPPGYKLPSNVEWGHIFYTGGGMTIPASGSTNPYNTTTISPASPNQGSSSSSEKNRFQMHRHTRNSLVVDGVEIDKVDIFKITDIRFYSGESMVFLGFGSQSSPTEITLNQSVYPIATSGPTHFVINFNNDRTSYGNLSGSGVHTRTIRCVKSPTNFIVE
ncbi:MAG: hypothetical protein ACRCZM_12055 [Bacteroidales bacterium]